MVGTPPELGGEAPGPMTKMKSLTWNLLPKEGLGNPSLCSWFRQGPSHGHLEQEPPSAPWSNPSAPSALTQQPLLRTVGRAAGFPLALGPGPGSFCLEPEHPLCSAALRVPPLGTRGMKPGHLGCLHSGCWACRHACQRPGVASTTGLSSVAWTVSWGCHDPRGHLTGEAKGWVQAGLSSEQGGCSRLPRESSCSWGPSTWGGPSWLLLVMMGQLSVAPSSGAEARGAKTRSQIGKILLLGWTWSTNKSMIK